MVAHGCVRRIRSCHDWCYKNCIHPEPIKLPCPARNRAKCEKMLMIGIGSQSVSKSCNLYFSVLLQCGKDLPALIHTNF